jgi:hypothetical protein
MMAARKIVLEGLVEVDAMEDGRKAMIASVVDADGNYASGEDSGDGGIFVRLQSWDESLPVDDRHRELQGLVGKRIRVTIEEV